MFSQVILLLLTTCDFSFESNIAKPTYNRVEIPLLHNLATSPQSNTASELVNKGGAKSITSNLIQYAPLNDQQYKSAQYSRSSIPYSYQNSITSSANMAHGKKNLEPRVLTDLKPNKIVKCIEESRDTTSSNLSPGHNAVYRSQPLVMTPQKDLKKSIRINDFKLKHYKILNNKPYRLFYSYYNPVKDTKIMVDKFPQSSTMLIPLLRYHPHVREKYYKETQQNDQHRNVPTATANFHRLHLNIARVYSPRTVQPKSPIFFDTYSSK